MSKSKTFADFAAANPIRPQCWLCKVDPKLRELIRDARHVHGGSYSRIARWLTQDHGTKVSEGAVRSHFANGHES